MGVCGLYTNILQGNRMITPVGAMWPLNANSLYKIWVLLRLCFVLQSYKYNMPQYLWREGSHQPNQSMDVI